MNEPDTASAAMDMETGKDVDPTLAIHADGSETDNPQRKCCGCFHGHQSVIGYNILGLGRGGVVMSNIYLATSLIYLACKEAGGVDPVTDECVNSDLTVYGMKPSALISNIAIVSGLLSAFLMPVFGAIVDYTDHRKMMGVLSAALLTVIEAIKIGTVESTWFAIAILQAFAGFLYQIQVVSVYAYLPEMAREVGQNRMNNYTSIFQQSQFSSQAIYTIVVVGISFGLSLGTVRTAMVGQGTVVIWCVILFSWGWKYLPARRARHTLSDGQWLLLAGFAQNWKTAKAIWTQYRKGVKWYLLATIFAEASTAAITSISVIYLTDVVGLSVSQIGIFFLITLVSTIPGAKLGMIITHHTNPNTSWKLSQVAVLICMLIGALTLDNLKGPKELCYIWGVSVGVLLGWYYPAMNLFFSMCLPQGQEAELAGFWVYCTQILAWLPPLIFTVLVQNDVDQKFGVISVSFGYVVSVLLLSCTSPWDEILVEADHNKNLHLVDDDVVDAIEKDVPTTKHGSDEEASM